MKINKNNKNNKYNKNNMKNISFFFAIATLCAFSTLCASAQVTKNRPPSEISVHIGSGKSSIHYQDALHDGYFNGNALDLAVGYTIFVHGNCGIYLGLEHGVYNTQKSVSFDVLTSDMTDYNGYKFDLYSTIGYHERFQTSFLNLPVMLLYQTKKGSLFDSWIRYKNVHQGLYAMGVVKVAVPLKNNYESRITSINNAAYYPEFENWGATQNFAGLGAFDGYGSNSNIGLDLSFRFSLEAGFKWRLNENFVLYTGAFCDFAFNQPVSNNRESFRNNVAVEHISDFHLLDFSQKADIVVTGIKVRLALSRIRSSAHCPFWD